MDCPYRSHRHRHHHHTDIPPGTILMEYHDERSRMQSVTEIRQRTDTQYTYHNHNRNILINTSQNEASYCGYVNEADTNIQFNTRFIEQTTAGVVRVYFQSTRLILANEELFTCYSPDGSFWH